VAVAERIGVHIAGCPETLAQPRSRFVWRSMTMRPVPHHRGWPTLCRLARTSTIVRHPDEQIDSRTRGGHEEPSDPAAEFGVAAGGIPKREQLTLWW